MNTALSFLLMLIPAFLAVDTTRYWDCCKPSCTWESNVGTLGSGATPVKSCHKDGSEADVNAINICTGGGDTSNGPSYTCTDNQPWYDSSIDAMFGFVASNTACCECYKLTFTSGTIAGSVMYVQTTNAGEDLGGSHFDILMPGGGLGIFNGCVNGDDGSPPANGDAQFSGTEGEWGVRYGGVTSQSMCNNLPSELQAGCNWRYESFLDADNPSANAERISCPSELTSITNCWLAEDGTPTSIGSGTSNNNNDDTDNNNNNNNNDDTGSCTDTGCGCNWASSATCSGSNGDGSVCFTECCCKAGFSDSTDTVSTPTESVCTDDGCKCNWASSAACSGSNNDGSACWTECCCNAGFYNPIGGFSYVDDEEATSFGNALTFCVGLIMTCLVFN